MKECELLIQFNEATKGRFSYCKFSGAEVHIPAQYISIHFVYPEDKQAEIKANRAELTEIVRGIVRSRARVEVHFTMSHFDEQFFKARMIRFFEKYPTIAPYVFADDLRFSKDGDGTVRAVLRAEESVCQSIAARGLLALFQGEINDHYCEKIVFSLEPVASESAFDSIDAYLTDTPLYVLEDESGRFITPEMVEEFIGPIVYDKAKYIADCKKQGPGIVIAGKVGGMTALKSRPKEAEAEGKPFYKFTLSDLTGEMKCLFFPGKKYAERDLTPLNGKDVVLKGEVKQSTYKGELSLDFFARQISLCQLPKDMKENRIVRLVPERYETVKPLPYVSAAQLDLFGGEAETPPYLLGKTFCIIDVETTGLDARSAKIIEIGGVKMVDGVMTETFSTFVDPLEPIQQKTTELTGITDAEVTGAPTIDKAIADFYKFVDGSILVGHNVAFDIAFLNAAGKPHCIRLDNAREDTLALAQRYLRGLPNFKLDTVVKHFGLTNERAHRAIYDCLATAEVFKRLAAFVGSKQTA